MLTQPQSDISTINHLASESESIMITHFHPSDVDGLPRRPHAVSDASDDGEASDPGSNQDLCDSKLEYKLSLCYYGDHVDDPIQNSSKIHRDALSVTTSGSSSRSLVARKLTPPYGYSSKPPPIKVSKNYKHKKTTTIQIADPETAITCSITRVLSCTKTGKRKSISRVSFWVEGQR